MKDKLISALGLCRKAGKLAYGFEASCELMRNGAAMLVMTSSDLSPKSKKEVGFIAGKHGVQTACIPVTIDEIDRGTGRRAGVLAVTDAGFVTLIKTAINRANGEE